MAALFGNSGARQGKKNLVEFKAGKMYLKGKMCHPDKRKGLVYVHQSEDSLMHFCWKDRASGKTDDDLIIFPDDVEFKRVPECTTGRVYVLKFKSSNRKFIFWLQEPKTDKDEENCTKVNELLNNPPTPGSTRTGNSAGGLQATDIANLGEAELSNLLGGMNQQQLLQLIGGMGGLGGSAPGIPESRRITRPTTGQSQESATPPRVQSAPEQPSAEPATPPQPRPVTASVLPGSDPPANNPSSIQIADLQNVLSNMSTPQPEPIDLSVALNAEKMIPILADPAVKERLKELLPQDPSIPSEEELRGTVSTPQFKQALASFSSALATGELGSVLAQFGLAEQAIQAANKGDVEAFVKALQDDEKDEAMDQD